MTPLECNYKSIRQPSALDALDFTNSSTVALFITKVTISIQKLYFVRPIYIFFVYNVDIQK